MKWNNFAMDLLTHIFSWIESLGGIMGVKRPWWEWGDAKHVVIKLYSSSALRMMNQHSVGLWHISSNFTRLRSLKVINNMIQRLGAEILKMMIILRSLRDLRRRGKRVFRCHLVVGGAGRRAGSSRLFWELPSADSDFIWTQTIFIVSN